MENRFIVTDTSEIEGMFKPLGPVSQSLQLGLLLIMSSPADAGICSIVMRAYARTPLDYVAQPKYGQLFAPPAQQSPPSSLYVAGTVFDQVIHMLQY